MTMQINAGVTNNLQVGNTANINLQDLFMTVMTERSKILDEQIRGQASKVQGQNDKLRQMNELVSQVRLGHFSQPTNQTPFSQKELSNGDEFLNLGDGYGVIVEQTGANRSWKIVEYEMDKHGNPVLDTNGDPKIASSTRIWGDPHVDEADGRWDFKDQSSFILPNGTKITVATTDWNNNEKVSDALYIARGNEQIKVSNLSDNSGTDGVANDTFEIAHDGTLFSDKDINDGAVFVSATGKVNDWKQLQGSDLTQGDKVNYNAQIGEYYTMPLTDANRALLNEIGFDYTSFANGSVIIMDEATLESLKQSIGSFTDSLTGNSQLEMTKLQSVMGKYNQSFEQLSNFLSKYQSSLDSITGNVR